MKSLKYAISYGVLIWLIPFVVSVLIFFLHTTERALFESIMQIIGVFVGVLFTLLYYKKFGRSLREGVFLSILWVLISLSFDFLFFIMGPGRMNIIDYVKDIGISYIAIPIVVLGLSFPLNKREE